LHCDSISGTGTGTDGLFILIKIIGFAPEWWVLHHFLHCGQHNKFSSLFRV